jgi:hypothetical protein
MTEPLVEPIHVAAFASAGGNRTVVKPATPMPVELTNSESRNGSDAIGASLVTMPIVHQRIHLGQVFTFSHVFSSVADDANADILIKVPAGIECHAICDVVGGGNFEILIYEGTTVSGDGTAVTVHNRNRSSAAMPDTDTFYTPTISATGTLLYSGFNPGGTKSSAVGGDFRFDNEIIFKASTNYLIRMTNRAGAAKTLAFSMTAYEE